MNTAEDELTGFGPGTYGNPHIDQADAAMQGTVVVMMGACLVIYQTTNAADKLSTLVQTTRINSTYPPRISLQELLVTEVNISYLPPPPQLMHLYDKLLLCILQKETLCPERTKGFQ
jgi:hypothetical protein